MGQALPVHLTVPKPAIIKNKFAVPQKKWKEWGQMAKIIFNELYETMLKNQEMFLHPKTEQVAPARWKTTCWNAAWTAADALK